jgi:proteasome accessory factor B
MSTNRPSYGDAIQVVLMLRMLERRTSGEMPVNLVAERLEVHRRTIIRYVKAISQVIMNDHGEPLIDLIRRDGETWVVMNRNPAPVASNVFQYAAIHAATSHLAAVGDPVLGDSARFVLGRLEDQIDVRFLERVKNGFYYVPFGPKSYDENEDVLDTVTQAVLRSRPVDIAYLSPGNDEPKTRRIEPYTLVMYRDGLYVLAKVGDRLSLFAIDRIRDATLDRTTQFEVPDTFSPAQFFGKRLGIWQANQRPIEVQLAFAKGAARKAEERRWPGFRGWRTLDDGRRVLYLRIPITPEVITWIRTWGPEAEVLAPEDLRQDIANELQRAAALYSQPALVIPEQPAEEADADADADEDEDEDD